MDEIFGTPVTNPQTELSADFFGHDDTPKPREEGEYRVRIAAYEYKENPSTGAYGVNWTVVFDDGQEYKYYTYIGRKVNGVLTETEKGFSTRNLIRSALNLSYQELLERAQAGKLQLTDAIGKVVTAVVVHEEYERDGETRVSAKIKTVKSFVTDPTPF